MIMEAMYYKTPVVTTKVKSIQDLLIHGEFCDVGDYKDMAQKIHLVLEKGYSKKKIQENRNFIEINNKFEQIITEYENEYKKLL